MCGTTKSTQFEVHLSPLITVEFLGQSSLVKCQQTDLSCTQTIGLTKTELQQSFSYTDCTVMFLGPCCLFLRECDRSEDKHLCDEFWAGVRYRHGECVSPLPPPHFNQHCESADTSRSSVCIHFTFNCLTLENIWHFGFCIK